VKAPCDCGNNSARKVDQAKQNVEIIDLDAPVSHIHQVAARNNAFRLPLDKQIAAFCALLDGTES
jgi:hypothetical protein